MKASCFCLAGVVVSRAAAIGMPGDFAHLVHGEALRSAGGKADGHVGGGVVAKGKGGPVRQVAHAHSALGQGLALGAVGGAGIIIKYLYTVFFIVAPLPVQGESVSVHSWDLGADISGHSPDMCHANETPQTWHARRGCKKK